MSMGYSNQTKIPLKAAIFEVPSISDVSEDSDGHQTLDGSGKITYDLLNRWFNITLVVPSERSKLGIRNEDGTYDGALGLLQRNEADVSAWPLFMEKYTSDFEWTTPIDKSLGLILSPKFEPTQKHFTVLNSFRSFELSLWGLIFTYFIIFLISMSIFSYVLNKNHITIRYAQFMLRKFSYKRVFREKVTKSLWILTSLGLRQHHVTSNYYTLNLTMTVFITYALLIQIWFSNSFRTNLIVFDYPKNPETLEDVLEMHFKPAITGSDPMAAVIIDSQNPLHIRMMQVAREHKTYQEVLNMEDFQDKLFHNAEYNTSSAIIANNFIFSFTKRLICNERGKRVFYISKNAWTQMLASFPMNKNISSALKDVLNYKSALIMQSGIISYLAEKLPEGAFRTETYALTCVLGHGEDNKSTNDWMPFDVVAVLSVIYLYSAGLTMCSFIILFELYKNYSAR